MATIITTINKSESEINLSAKYKCLICKKEYSRKASIDKHRILCDFKSKSKTEIIIEEQEASDKPTYDQLVKIVQELAIKQAKMEAKDLWQVAGGCWTDSQGSKGW